MRTLRQHVGGNRGTGDRVRCGLALVPGRPSGEVQSMSAAASRRRGSPSTQSSTASASLDHDEVSGFVGDRADAFADQGHCGRQRMDVPPRRNLVIVGDQRAPSSTNGSTPASCDAAKTRRSARAGRCCRVLFSASSAAVSPLPTKCSQARTQLAGALQRLRPRVDRKPLVVRHVATSKILDLSIRLAPASLVARS